MQHPFFKKSIHYLFYEVLIFCRCPGHFDTLARKHIQTEKKETTCNEHQLCPSDHHVGLILSITCNNYVVKIVLWFLPRNLVYRANVTMLTAWMSNHVHIHIQHYSETGGLWLKIQPQKTRMWWGKDTWAIVCTGVSCLFLMTHSWLFYFCDWLLLFSDFFFKDFSSNTVIVTFTKKRKHQASWE